MFKKPKDFTRGPEPPKAPKHGARGPEPPKTAERGGDGFDINPDSNHGCWGCLWPGFCISVPLVVFIGFRAGWGWIILLPIGVFVGFGVLMVVGNFRPKRLKDLLTLVPALLMLYGIVAFVAPAGAGYIVPGAWPWPMPREAEVLVLDDGRRAAALEGPGRLQIYDADGRYQGGWFVSSTGGSFKILGPDPAVGADTVLVYCGRELVLYDLDGRVLRRETAPEHFKAQPQGRFETMAFQSPWYLWPLVHPVRGWICAAAGMLLMVIGIFLRPDDPEDLETAEEPPPADIPAAPEKFVDRRKLRLGCLLAAGLAVGVAAVAALAGLAVQNLAAVAIVGGWAFGLFMAVWLALKAVGGSGRNRLSALYLAVVVASALLGLYGVTAFVGPGLMARNFIPADWEWPMSRTSRMLELPDGRLAGRQLSAHRVQIYDSSGRYLGGWYLDNGFTILGPGPGGSGLEVQFSDQKILFDLQGRVLSREELPDYAPLPETGRFIEMRFDTPFYKLPLTNPVQAWVLALVGLLGVGFSRSRRRRVA